MLKFLAIIALSISTLFGHAKAFCGDNFFIIVVNSFNNEEFCEASLMSVFNQTYTNYRVIYIDDASSDSTIDKVTALVKKHNQRDRFTLIRNKERLGVTENCYRNIRACDDQDIIVMLNADDWFLNDQVLEKLNRYYSSADIWLTYGGSVDYPGYKRGEKHQRIPYRMLKNNAVREYSRRGIRIPPLKTFYAGLFKQVKLQDVVQNGAFIQSMSDQALMIPMIEMAGKRVLYVDDVLYVNNCTNPLNEEKILFEMQRECSDYVLSLPRYMPLHQFPQMVDEREIANKADLVIFSCDRPMQLCACLESIQRYVTDVDKITVIMRYTDKAYADSYLAVQNMFPKITFVKQMGAFSKDFKEFALAAVFGHPAEYVAFLPDDLIVKDYVHFKECIAAMRKTGAYGFYLRMGKHIDYCYRSDTRQPLPLAIPVGDNMYAWQFQVGEGDWKQSNALDMTLFKKSEIKDDLIALTFHNPTSLEKAWNEIADLRRVGLFYAESKIVNVPLNIVDDSTHRHMHSYTKLELLELFKEGMKMDIYSLFQVKNRSAHMEYDPAFRKR